MAQLSTFATYLSVDVREMMGVRLRTYSRQRMIGSVSIKWKIRVLCIKTFWICLAVCVVMRRTNRMKKMIACRLLVRVGSCSRQIPLTIGSIRNSYNLIYYG